MELVGGASDISTLKRLAAKSLSPFEGDFLFTRRAQTLTLLLLLLLLPFVSQRASVGLPGIVMTTVCTHRHSRRLKTMQRKCAKLTRDTCSSEINYKLEANNAIKVDKSTKGKGQV